MNAYYFQIADYFECFWHNLVAIYHQISIFFILYLLMLSMQFGTPFWLWLLLIPTVILVGGAAWLAQQEHTGQWVP